MTRTTFVPETVRSSGDLDFNTLNKVDYLKNEYGRPLINKIKDSNIFDIDQAVISDKRETKEAADGE